MNYNHKEIENKWKNFWDEKNIFFTDVRDFSKPKYYALDMFPYPSGAGLHVGHVKGYTATDAVSRMKRMQGYNVLHPMGFDSYGLPAEQFAIKTGNHPIEFTHKNIDNFKNQLRNLGLSFDWSKEISTCEPEYYKWTQWIFENLYKDKLAVLKDMPVNWCEELGTVLANDEVIDGKSERGGFPVVKKNMKQWVVKITNYCDRFLSQLDDLDWPKSTKEIQKNWIGRSEGAEVTFCIENSNESFTVFTTRPDTLFGVTYCALAPEHPLVDKIKTNEYASKVDEYVARCKAMSDLQRTELNKEKTGVFLGAYAINPVNNKKVPIYIADYVMMNYGTGAAMAVPAHDERDYDFAKKFDLPIIEVLKGGDISKEAFVGDGEHINSEFLNGLGKSEAIKTMIDWLEENNLGKRKINYKMRDWIFARQRYWGEPMPVIYMDDGSVELEKNLPLHLPNISNYKPNGGKAPLDNAIEWKNVIIDGKHGVRETSTMPGSAASSWYYLRYVDPHNDEKFADYDLLKHWLPVDLYLGGAEHAVGHLLYSRMWNNYLYDKGLSPVKEPFKKLIHQGMILGANSEKMSKSKGNVVNPDDIVESHGADTLRLFEMFLGPIVDSCAWSTTGVDGARRFLDRVWRLYTEENKIQDVENPNLDLVYNQTVKKVTEDFENLYFNTAISQIMIFVNCVYKERVFPLKYAKNLLKLLNPITPFITEELWQMLGENDSITYAKWPNYDENKLQEDDIEIGIQVNGKFKDRIKVSRGTSVEDLKAKALESPKIASLGEPKKVIAIVDKFVNIII